MKSLFLVFAFAYFLSALLRAVTATLAPAFTLELGLQSADLGLLAGAYFFGFAVMQLPLGRALDHFGPRRVLISLLALAVVGCAAFALADSLPGLLAARVLIGMGVSACLMAPLTAYRRVFSPGAQLRANSWMLMTGSLGMLASTLPVQWLLPVIGWRGLFVAVAGLLVVAMALVLARVPRDPPASTPVASTTPLGYVAILRHPLFVQLWPLGFVVYGGLIAVQSLWAGPWLTRVAGLSPTDAARGLFIINLSMLFAFMAWGAVMPRLTARGIDALFLIRWGVPIKLAVLLVALAIGERAGAGIWALWCVSCTCVALSQPTIGQAFETAQAGRALSAYNLVIFAGVFCVQWGIGLAIDALAATGMNTVATFQAAFGGYAALCLAAYLWFLRRSAP